MGSAWTSIAGAIAAIGLFSVATTAEARPRCYAPITGFGQSTGLFGQGSENARGLARVDFEQRATSRYGDRYGNINNARGVTWRCKKNAILLAECRVTARPCRY